MDQHILMSQRRDRFALFYWGAKKALAQHAMTVGGTLLLAVIFYGPPKVAVAQPDRPSLSRTSRLTDPSRVIVPRDLGQVTQTFDVANPTFATKLLILIQDAHVNYEAQQHLAKIIDRLAATYDIRLILVEGGEGAVGLSRLRTSGSSAARKEVADAYLKEGLVSGEEYLDIVSNHPLILWGVDDHRLYDRHMQAFLEVEHMRQTAAPQLAQLRQAVDGLKAVVFNTSLNAVDAAGQRFAAEQLSFDDYLQLLRRQADALAVRLDDYPQLAQTIRVQQLASALQQPRVAEEQRQALELLRVQGAPQALAELNAVNEQVRNDQTPLVYFYQTLAARLQAAHVDPARFPQLRDYTTYLQLQAALSSKETLAELEAFRGEMQRRLARSSDEQMLLEIDAGLTVYERLLQLRWTPKEFESYTAHKDEWRISRWVPFLQLATGQHGVAWPWTADAVALEAHLAQATRFYEAAEARDGEIVRRALAKMDETGERTAVLVAGGFHAEHVSRLLADRQVRLAVITPWVGQSTDDAQYTAVLKRKYAHRRLPADIASGAPTAP